jgi:hypothetical protein
MILWYIRDAYLVCCATMSCVCVCACMLLLLVWTCHVCEEGVVAEDWHQRRGVLGELRGATATCNTIWIV